MKKKNNESNLKIEDIKNDGDIEKMSWEDREKVLKFLFAKINALPLKITNNEKEKLVGEESKEGLANLT